MSDVIKRPNYAAVSWGVVKVLYHILLPLIVAATALWQTNLFPFLIAAAAAIWFGVAHEISRRDGFFQISERLRVYHRPHYFPSAKQYWAALGAPALAVAVSSCVFMSFPFTDYHVVDKGNGAVEYGGRLMLTTFNPYSDIVRNYSASKTVYAPNRNSVGFRCNAITLDRKPVRAAVAADLSLPFSGLEAAYAASGSDSRLDAMVRGELCARFTHAISTYSLAGMPPFLSLESSAAGEKKGMNDMGVLYTGIVWIGDMHAYADQLR